MSVQNPGFESAGSFPGEASDWTIQIVNSVIFLAPFSNRAAIFSSRFAPFDLTAAIDGVDDLVIVTDTGTTTVTFVHGDFVDSSVATAQEVVDKIQAAFNAQDPGSQAAVSVDSQSFYLRPATDGFSGSISVSASDFRDAFRFTSQTIDDIVPETTEDFSSLWAGLEEYRFHLGGEIVSGISGPWVFTDGATLTFDVDGSSQTVTIFEDDVASISAVDPIELAAIITSQLIGAEAAVVETNKVKVFATTFVTVQHTGGTATAVTAFPTDLASPASMELFTNQGIQAIEDFETGWGQFAVFDELTAIEAMAVGGGATIRTQKPVPWTLDAGLTLSFIVNNGSAQDITLDAADFDDITQATASELANVITTRAVIGSTIDQTYNIAGEEDITIRVTEDGVIREETARVVGAEITQGAATAAEVAATLAPQLSFCIARPNSLTNGVEFASVGRGPDVSIEVVSGTLAAVLGIALLTPVAGTGISGVFCRASLGGASVEISTKLKDGLASITENSGTSQTFLDWEDGTLFGSAALSIEGFEQGFGTQFDSNLFGGGFPTLVELGVTDGFESGWFEPFLDDFDTLSTEAAFNGGAEEFNFVDWPASFTPVLDDFDTLAVESAFGVEAEVFDDVDWPTLQLTL